MLIGVLKPLFAIIVKGYIYQYIFFSYCKMKFRSKLYTIGVALNVLVDENRTFTTIRKVSVDIFIDN